MPQTRDEAPPPRTPALEPLASDEPSAPNPSEGLFAGFLFCIRVCMRGRAYLGMSGRQLSCDVARLENVKP